MSRLLLPLFLSFIAAQPLIAVDNVHVRDIRLTIGSTPETDEVEQRYVDKSGAGSQSTLANSSLETSSRFGVEMTESFGNVTASGGWVLSLGYAHSEQKSDKDLEYNPRTPRFEYHFIGSIKQTVNVGTLALGYAVPMGQGLHGEFSGFGGLGTATASHRTINAVGGATRFNGVSSAYYEYGAKAGVFCTFKSHLQLGLEGGWMISHADTEIKYFVDYRGEPDGTLTEEDTIDQSGPFGTLTLGIRF
jgi:hypothetical protein